MSKRKVFKVPRPKNNTSVSSKWTLIVLIMSFCISICFSAITTLLMNDIEILLAFLILLIIIIINVLFDMIGTSVMAAEEYPFHSLARRKVKGAKECIDIIRHAPHVSSICCDVIGDIAGIVSGAATALIIEELVKAFGFDSLVPSLLLTGTVAALTIGGKAFFKGFAMQNGNTIVFRIGKIMRFVRKR